MSAIDAERIAALFEEAALAPDVSASLAEACERAAPLMHAPTVYLLRLAGPQPVIIGGASARALNDAYQGEEWWRVDEVSEAARAQKAIGLKFDYELVAPDTLRRSVLYNDFLQARGLGSCMGWGFAIDGEHWGCAALRGRRHPFAEEDRPALQRMIPVVNRAVLLASRLRLARACGMAEGIEAAGHAAVVLDGRGMCAFISESAKRLFDAELAAPGGHLWAADPEAARGLAALAAAASGRLPGVLQSVVVPRRDRRPVLVLPIRVRGVGLEMLPGARLVLLLVDLAPKPRRRLDLLRQVYRLTPREADVATRLAAGKSATMIADELALQVAAVRQVVKSVLEKTETHRQAELAALLARMPEGGG
jgi:DNA-binding CsgD family transcriptional regulator